MKMNKEQHNIVSFLKSLLYSFETLAESKEIELVFNSESDWIPVIFDSEKLERVFLNLITNAFKFTDSGGEIGIEVKKRLTVPQHERMKVPESALPWLMSL